MEASVNKPLCEMTGDQLDLVCGGFGIALAGGGGDISAMCYMVMMNSANSTDGDLATIMSQVKSISNGTAMNSLVKLAASRA
jgi:hypothetical protein